MSCGNHRINKYNRAAGVLDNYEEGRVYRDYEFQKYLLLQRKTVMPTFNDCLTEILPKYVAAFNPQLPTHYINNILIWNGDLHTWS